MVFKRSFYCLHTFKYINGIPTTTKNNSFDISNKPEMFNAFFIWLFNDFLRNRLRSD